MLTPGFIFIVLQVIHFDLCKSNILDDCHSQREQIHFGGINGCVLKPTIKATDSFYANNEIIDVDCDKQPIPIINAFYIFDQSAVHILLDFIKISNHAKLLSLRHQHLVQKYIYEWFKDIQAPNSDCSGRFNEELRLDHNHITKSMGFPDVVVKNIIRVQIELQKIMAYSDDLKWKELVVRKISEAEALVGMDVLRVGELDVTSSSLAHLSITYSLHPFELYPMMFSKESSFPSFIHAAIHASNRQLMSASLEWLEATKSLLTDDVEKVWQKIHLENGNISKSLKRKDKYWIKIRNLREKYENEREGFVNLEMEKLEKIFHVINSSSEDKDWCNKAKKFSNGLNDYLYLNIVSNISSILHDLRFHDQDPNDYYGFFPRSVREESVSTQSSKLAKEHFVRNFFSLDNDQDLKMKQSKLCRGDYSMKRMSKYYCRLDHRNSPYLLLMPVKVEHLNSDPEVMIFHHIVGVDKIHNFQQMALPIATISKVQGSTLDATLSENVLSRRSYIAWLHELLSKKTAAFNNLLGHVTGYDVTSENGASELLQVNSYTSGGFYAPHQDAFDVFTTFDKAEDEETLKGLHEKHSNGDRIATFMIYLNDDLIGGQTTFPHLGISAAPERGSAIYWRNTYLNGTIHPHALHSGCQVLAGVKWVANKWIRSYAQMFRRPCALEKNM